MPKLYEYFGIVVFFYSNEHEPVHVHGRSQGRENRAELVVEEGKVVDVRIVPVRGRRPLEGSALRDFETFVRAYAGEIVQRWVDYFVLHKQVSSQTITQRIR